MAYPAWRWVVSGAVFILGALLLYSAQPPSDILDADRWPGLPRYDLQQDDLLLLTDLHRSGKLTAKEKDLIKGLDQNPNLAPKVQDLIRDIQENPVSETRPQLRDLLMKTSLYNSEDSNNTSNSVLPEIKDYGDMVTKHGVNRSIDYEYGIYEPPLTNAEGNGEDLARKQLISGLVQNVVHYIWCGQRFFQFQNYLAILSAIRILQPDKVVFHYEHKPVEDDRYYFQWIDNLVHDYPFFEMIALKNSQVSFCSGTKQERMHVILGMLAKDGGMFIGENTWLINYSTPRRNQDLESALNMPMTEGFLLVRGNLFHPNVSYEDLLRNSSLTSVQTTCATVNYLHRIKKQPDCLVVQFDSPNELFPHHIWELDNKFGRIARTIFYGSPDIKVPKPTFEELVPNIGHMVWIGGGEMDFVFYLSVLSLLYVVGVDNLYIHGDVPPTGPYWESIRDYERIHFIARPEPSIVYQGFIDWYYRALMSDIIRVDLMIKYGGIYTDTDAIWVKPLSKEDRGYEAVATFDWVDWSLPFPDTVNFGVSYGKRNAPFWRVFRESMRTLHNDVHGFTGVMNPYKLLERYPHLLRIKPHLCVICYEFECHPTYVKNYHNSSNNHLTTNSIPNWREDVHAFHWTNPNPDEYKDQETLLNSTGMFAEIGQYVLNKAGIV